METQFDRQKFKDLVLYVCAACEPSKLGAVKLHKVLYFADMLAYAGFRKPITGESYVKQRFGPTARHLLPIIGELEREGFLQVTETEFYGYQKKQFHVRRDIDTARFSEDEIRLIERVIAWVCNQTASEISDLTHDEVWRAADMGEEIPYFTVLNWFPTEITDKHRAWGAAEAEKIVERAQ